MSAVMSHQCHTNTVGQVAIDNVIRKPLEICATEAGLDQVKHSWFRCGNSDHSAQLRFELLAEVLRDRIVSLQRLRHVLLDGGMIFDPHRFRPASTRLQNSTSFNGWIWPATKELPGEALAAAQQDG
jgi:hypothetical protein